MVDNVTKVLSLVDLQADTINNTYIKYLAENHVYIINMQKMALNILTVKVNVKPTIGSTWSSPLGYHWGLFKS